MTRLLLGEDLCFYEDGVAHTVRPPYVYPGGGGTGSAAGVSDPAELPYHDSRYVGRALTVAADGTLTWVLNEHVPEVNATMAGAILTINDRGNAEWVHAIPTPGGLVNDEVVPTDAVGLGVMYYGHDTPADPQDGAFWIVTHMSVEDIPPPPPSAAPVIAQTTSGVVVTVTWGAVANADSYEVRIDGVPSYQVTGLKVVLNFQENESHAIVVVAHNEGGYGPVSNTLNVAIANLPPPVPTHPVLLGNQRASQFVGWDYLAEPPDFNHFIVTASVGTVGTINTVARSVGITNAPDDVQVAVYIQAVDDLGLLSASAQMSYITPPAPPPEAPSPPTALTNTRVGYSSADFTWGPPVTGTATGYEYSTNGLTFTNIGLVTSYTLTGLSEFTDYHFYVRAVGEGGASAAPSVAFTTLHYIARYDTTYVSRTFGYQNEAWSGIGISHGGSGVLGTQDNWALGSGQANWQRALDQSLGSWPTTLPAENRWINFDTTLAYDDVDEIVLWWKYGGRQRIYIYDDVGVERYSNSKIVTGGFSNTVSPSIAPDGHRIARIQIMLVTDTSLSSNPDQGKYGLQEWKMTVRAVSTTTPVYNEP